VIITCNLLIVCTRVYRFFNPEPDEAASSDNPSSSSSFSLRRQWRNCIGVFFPSLHEKRDDPPTAGAGKVCESTRVPRTLLSLRVSWFSFQSPLSSMRARRESDKRLEFSHVESCEFEFASRTLDIEEGVDAHNTQRSNQNLEEEEGDGRKNGGVGTDLNDSEKTRAEIPPTSSMPRLSGGVLSTPSPSLPPTKSPPSSLLPLSSFIHIDLDPLTGLDSSEFSPIRFKDTRSEVEVGER
jgi:hypothetical protein